MEHGGFCQELKTDSSKILSHKQKISERKNYRNTKNHNIRRQDNKMTTTTNENRNSTDHAGDVENKRHTTIALDNEPPFTSFHNTSGIMLESVGCFVDKNGLHPLYSNGLPDLHKDMTVPYAEVEYIEFTSMMTDKDVVLYKVALKEYVPQSKQSKVWNDEVWRNV